MDKTFEPKSIEQQCYQKWETSGMFKASGHGDPYSILLPPPNVTGSLHMGHDRTSCLLFFCMFRAFFGYSWLTIKNKGIYNLSTWKDS